jgi:hypothetical protein
MSPYRALLGPRLEHPKILRFRVRAEHDNNPRPLPLRKSIILGIGDMCRGEYPTTHRVVSLSEHVSTRFFSIANSS